MAIFEKTTHNKDLTDDTEKLTCTITTTQNIDKHTEYILKVHKGPLKEPKWNVSHRYRHFAALHSILQQSNIDLPMPPKKLIGNMQPSFVAERQIALQNYLNEILKHHILSLNLHVRRFLNPSAYSQDLTEQALQTVSIALRGDGRFELKGPLPDIGWRIRKHYFLVNDTQSRTNCILSYQNYGPDRYLCDKDMQAAFKSIQNLTHQYIDPVLAIQNLEAGAYVVRKIHENGSLMDVIYDTEYNKSYLTKYGNPKIRKPLTLGQIAHYGSQILQALKFLHHKGLPHGNIHAANVTIENHKVQLLDIENYLLGVPSLYRPYIIELKKNWTAEAIDVYCFGRMLYEMACAKTLDSVYCDNFPEDFSVDFEWVLRLCISSESCKHQMPSIEELLDQPFFSHHMGLVNGYSDPVAPHLKFPTALKEELRLAVEAVGKRIRNDQKLVRTARRELRIQEILSSDEELRKHRRKLRKRESMWKSTSSLATTVRSNSMSIASSPTPPQFSNFARQASVPCASTSTPTSAPSSSPPAEGRSALLNAICNFDKKRLARIESLDR